MREKRITGALQEKRHASPADYHERRDRAPDTDGTSPGKGVRRNRANRVRGEFETWDGD